MIVLAEIGGQRMIEQPWWPAPPTLSGAVGESGDGPGAAATDTGNRCPAPRSVVADGGGYHVAAMAGPALPAAGRAPPPGSPGERATGHGPRGRRDAGLHPAGERSVARTWPGQPRAERAAAGGGRPASG